LLKEFFEEFEIENLDQELFEQIKKRLSLEVFIESKDIPTG
jgi:predicted KAP-like P-loop ATPase